MTFTDIQERVAKTAAFTGAGIDVAAITEDWTIKLQVEALTAAKGARFQFEDTVNDWTASLVGPVFNLKGAVAAEYDKVKSWKKQDFPSLRIGTGSGQLRLKLAALDGSASVTYHAWLEY